MTDSDAADQEGKFEAGTSGTSEAGKSVEDTSEAGTSEVGTSEEDESVVGRSLEGGMSVQGLEHADAAELHCEG